ncbi:MAG: DinB family protein [Spirochaetia bacterium]
MNSEELLRKEVAALVGSSRAHEGFEAKVARFSVEYINSVVKGAVRPPDVPLTPYALLEHMRIAQWDIVEFIRNPDHVSPSYPEGLWPDPKIQADAELWRKTLDEFRADLEALVSFARDKNTDLFAPIPHAKEYTIFRELLTAADHNSYHIGQFGIFGDYFAGGAG